MDFYMLETLQPEFAGEIRENEPLRYHTGLRMGGPAKLLIIPQGMEGLRKTVVWAGKNNVPLRTIGNGTSVLVSPSGFQGVVIKLTRVLNHIRVEDNLIYAGAGASLAHLLSRALNHELAGLEQWWGPSTVGGWLVRSGLTNWPLLDQLIKEVFIMEPDGYISRWYEPSQLFLQDNLQGGLQKTVVEVVFRLQRASRTEIAEKMAFKQREWAFITQTGFPLAWPVFLPTGEEDYTELFAKIELASVCLKGVAFLGIGSGFLANLGSADFGGVLELLQLIQKKVLKVTGKSLQEGLYQLDAEEVIHDDKI